MDGDITWGIASKNIETTRKRLASNDSITPSFFCMSYYGTNNVNNLSQ